MIRQTLLAAAWLATAPALAEPLTLEPCRLADPSGRSLVRAECGSFEVPLDYDDPAGPRISLRVARLPALSDREQTVALTVIAGGPGQASTDFYAAYRYAFERIRESADVLIVDQRGTGDSNRLACPTPEQSLGDVWSLELTSELTRECLDNLSADPRLFTTSVAVRDLDEVRAAMGYEQLVLYGISYGTRVAQHYLRRYPDKTHSVILDGVVPVDLVLGPDIARHAQRALDLALRRCGRSEACDDAFPALRDDFRAVAGRLREQPVAVTLNDPLSAEVTSVDLGYYDFAGAIRLLSYAPDTVALLPLYLSEAARGNFQPITAEALALSRNFVDSLAIGMHNAVVCAEDAPFFDDEDTASLDSTYLGRIVFESLQATCKVWPRGVMDDDFKTPFASEVPVLVLSGAADPITPPAYGERTVEYLGNALHVVGPGQGHGMAAVGCIPRLMGEFVRDRSLETLDASCIDVQSAEPFFTSFAGPEP